eukprot:TRINITY_DN5383_c0_g1_i2.p1 TRINITY_DN5383_c0_g1~~TRINITY_DN5383_c0_g1_i2.p1  ORF type:complete len:409 (-),score=141.78 TRINITY_DN5383_c0_g1_i2:37-1263(-)
MVKDRFSSKRTEDERNGGERRPSTFQSVGKKSFVQKDTQPSFVRKPFNQRPTHGIENAKDEENANTNAKGGKKLPLKIQIIHLRQKLSQDDLLDEQRKRFEEEIAKLEAIEAKILEVQKAKDTEHKYRMLKFVERKRLTRKKESLVKKLQSTTDDGEIRAQLEKIDLDIEYIENFPPGHEYISILKPPVDEATKQKIEEMRVLGKQIREKHRRQREVRAMRAADPQMDIQSDEDEPQSSKPAQKEVNVEPQIEEDDFFIAPVEVPSAKKIDPPPKKSAPTTEKPVKHQKTDKAPRPHFDEIPEPKKAKVLKELQQEQPKQAEKQPKQVEKQPKQVEKQPKQVEKQPKQVEMQPKQTEERPGNTVHKENEAAEQDEDSDEPQQVSSKSAPIATPKAQQPTKKQRFFKYR